MERWVRLTAAGAVLVAGLVVATLLITRSPDAEPVRATTRTSGAPADLPSAGSPAAPPPEPTPSQLQTSASAVNHPQLMLPDLHSRPAFDLRIETYTDGEGEEHRRLRFSAGLANLGPGPLLVRRTGRGSCPDGRFATVQVIFEDRDGDRRFRRGIDGAGTRIPSGCMLDHPTHDHWHFDAMAAYTLHRPDATEALVSRDKVSFCLRDNTRLRGVPGTVAKEYYGECTRDTPQGISPGWVDVYEYDLDGQWLALPDGIDDEVLCLTLEADPNDLLAEVDGFDNASSIAIRINGTEVHRSEQVTCRPLPN